MIRCLSHRNIYTAKPRSHVCLVETSSQLNYDQQLILPIDPRAGPLLVHDCLPNAYPAAPHLSLHGSPISIHVVLIMILEQ
jgi:hypothetical protein